jgi:hypothetical protein
MAATPRRRWLRFSLRTMFVAFTVIAVWLGWNVHLVQQRTAFIESLPAPCRVRLGRAFTNWGDGRPMSAKDVEGLTAIVMTMDAKGVFKVRGPVKNRSADGLVPHAIFHPTKPCDVSLLRQWLGDDPYRVITYFNGPDGARTHALFPEAIVMVANDPWPWPNVKVTKSRRGWRTSYGQPD